MQKNRGAALQTILLVISGFIALVAVLMFSGIIPGFGGSAGGGPVAQIKVWGTLPADSFNKALASVNDANQKTFSVTYEQKNSATYDNELLNALAAGTGPDIFVIDHDSIIKEKDKIFAWPFASFSERGFKDRFTNGGEIFLQSDGVVGIPVLIDPLVLYWNRSLFASKSIVNPPKDWNEFLADAKQFTSQDKNGNIIFSGAAMGEFSNVKNSKEILSTLLMQSGDQITQKNGDSYSVVFGDADSQSRATSNAVSFFSGFSNVKLDTYSWNSALPQSDDAFAAGNLAMYIGFGSEVQKIKDKNPHLDFDIAQVPQLNPNAQMTFGRFYGMVLPANGKQTSSAMGAIIAIMDSDFMSNVVGDGIYAPARRDLLTLRPTDAFSALIYKSAAQSYAWLDPDPQKTLSIFKEMIQSILSGKNEVSAAVGNASAKLRNL